MNRSSIGVLIDAISLRARLPFMLWRMPLDAVVEQLTPSGVLVDSDSAEALARIEHITDAITRTLPIVRTACLQRALLRYALARRRGIPVAFAVGVRDSDHADGFEAHAWIELDSEPIMEREPCTYRHTFLFPPRSHDSR